MRILVCGSRNWDDVEDLKIYGALWSYLGLYQHLVIIEGGQATWLKDEERYIGADYFAAEWAKHWMKECEGSDMSVAHEQYKADWKNLGRKAGPIRNQRMLDEGRPDFVVAFTDDLSKSNGTRDMVTRAKKAGLPVYVVGHR